MSDLYIVGKRINEESKEWEFGGLYSSKEKAIQACTSDYYFIALVEVDKYIPDETCEWKLCYYPKLESEPELNPKGY